VVSSQAFSKQFPDLKTPAQQKAARAWLGNGMEQAVPRFLDRAAGKDVEGAIYHLTDDIWIIPSFLNYGGAVSLAYNHTSKDHTSDAAIKKIVVRVHHKFVVIDAEGESPVVFTGSANFSGNSLRSNDENLLEIT
jgi:phosphatidylserine/phosphatidylglycerophosphate/cardiolipin synthase-like enzyme